MTRLRAEVRVGRGHWYAACDRCRWSKVTGPRAGAQAEAADLVAEHNQHHHPTPEATQ